MNLTCRQDVGRQRRRCCRSCCPMKWKPSAGSWFHCLHATSHALQPMQTRRVGEEAGRRLRRRRRAPAERVHEAVPAAPQRPAASAGLRRSDSSQFATAMRKSPFRLGRRPACRGSARGSARAPCGTVGRGGRPVEPAGVDLAGEHLALVHAHVRVGHQRGQVVGVAADRSRRRSPSGTAGRSGGSTRPVDAQRLEAPRHHRPRLDRAARRAHRQPAAVLDAALGGQFRAQLDEHLRLQFVEPAVEPAHRPAQVVLGQPERAGHDGILRRRRVGDAVERPVEVAHRRAVVCCG